MARGVTLEFKGRDRSRRASQSVESNVRSLGRRVGAAAKSMGMALLGVTLGAAGLGAAFGKLFGAYAKQESAEIKLKAVLEATRGAIGLSFDQLKEYAGQLQKQTAVADEEIIDLMAKAATMTDLTGERFKQFVRVAIDLAKVTGKDNREAFDQLQQALVAPGEGMEALRQVGIRLTEDEEKLMRQFMDTGQAARAQSMLLQMLERRVGKVAMMLRLTAGGRWDAMIGAIGDVAEQIGGAIYKGAGLSEVLEKIRSGAEDLGSGLQARLTPHIERTAEAMRLLLGNEEEVDRGADIIRSQLNQLGAVMAPYAERAGQAIGRGLVDGIGSYLAKESTRLIGPRFWGELAEGFGDVWPRLVLPKWALPSAGSGEPIPVREVNPGGAQ